MKSVLKRRKHRKGIRPIRKGTLKVNMQELPNLAGLKVWGYLTQLLVNHGQTNWNDDFPKYNASQAEWNRYHINFERRKANLKRIQLIEQGCLFLTGNKQIDPLALALAAINSSTPNYFKRKEFNKTQTCKACEHANDCPFKGNDWFEKRITKMCPYVRDAFRDYNLDKTNILPLNQVDMAELALTHLS